MKPAPCEITLQPRYRSAPSGRWPIMVAPRPDEWLPGWLIRFGAANGLPARALGTLLNLGAGNWALNNEFGLPQGDADALQTVRDVLLAARGLAASSELAELKSIPAKWFRRPASPAALYQPLADNVAAAFLEQASRGPGRVIAADQRSGALTYRDLIVRVLLLRPELERLDGERLGLMLPACVATAVTYLATMFSGKTPVMLNWTLGTRGLLHTIELAGVRKVVTLAALVARLEGAGMDCSPFRNQFVFLEDVAGRLGPARKAAAALRSRVSWASLDTARVSDIAAILFTSGSEAVPKAVPLSHRNVIENLRSVLKVVHLTTGDRLLGFLPPFHALGLTTCMLAPLCFGVPTVYHPNPTEGAILARLSEAYQATVLIATPTFLGGILRAARKGQLAALRLAITGAEKCPDSVADAFERLCPSARLVEGYGVTECSPVITVNDPDAPQRGAIGRLLPSFERLLVHPETGQPLEPPATGMLLVRGPSVFDGYLGYAGPSPFIEAAGKRWYATGDIVSEDAAGVMTYRGRVKRFVKRGGEMVSLPAIEAAIRERCLAEPEEAPTIAVEATADEANPELVLFTTRPLEREAVNAQLRAAGLSPLHSIRRVVRLDAMPLLGTGKTDYRALRALLAAERAQGPPAALNTPAR